MCGWNEWLTCGGARWVAGPSAFEKTEMTACHGRTGESTRAQVLFWWAADNVRAFTWHDRPIWMRLLIELWWIFMFKSLRSFSASYPTTSFFCLKYYWCHFSLVCSARFEVLSRLDMIIFRPFRRQRSQGTLKCGGRYLEIQQTFIGL